MPEDRRGERRHPRVSPRARPRRVETGAEEGGENGRRRRGSAAGAQFAEDEQVQANRGCQKIANLKFLAKKKAKFRSFSAVSAPIFASK